MPDLDATPQSYYVPLGDGDFRPTLHAQGAWRSDEQHMAPVSALLVHCLEAFEPSEELRIGRITFDILGMIGADVTHVDVRTVRPGRTIRLDEAVASVGGRPVVRASAWRLLRGDSAALATDAGPALPSPEGLTPWEGAVRWGGGYISSLEFWTPDPTSRGGGVYWIRQTKTVVEGEDSTPVARYAGAIDCMNGVSPVVEPVEWMFPNVDLTVHLHRLPTSAEWVGLQTNVAVGPDGVGVTSAVLHDEAGPLGRAEQILTVRSMPGA